MYELRLEAAGPRLVVDPYGNLDRIFHADAQRKVPKFAWMRPAEAVVRRRAADVEIRNDGVAHQERRHGRDGVRRRHVDPLTASAGMTGHPVHALSKAAADVLLETAHLVLREPRTVRGHEWQRHR